MNEVHNLNAFRRHVIVCHREGPAKRESWLWPRDPRSGGVGYDLPIFLMRRVNKWI